MPRTKLRPDYNPRVFTYDITITGDVPTIVFDLARAQQDLWNAMAVELQRVAEASKSLLKEEKKAAYAAFDKWAYAETRKKVQDWPCWSMWQIYDSFTTARKTWAASASKGYKPGHPKYCGIPSMQRGLSRIKIEHRTNSGGVPVEWLYTDSDRKHTRIRAAEGLTRGYFTIKNERVPFEVVMHRAIPNDCILKRIALVGQHEPAFREWRWKIVLLVEDPPRHKEHGEAVASLDLGWRRLEDGLRLGVLCINDQPHEIYLPFNLANRSERRQIQYFDSTEMTRDIRQVWEMQSLLDTALEECKAVVKAADKALWPDDVKSICLGLTKMRAGGLRRLRRALWQVGIVLPEIEAWHNRHVEMSKRIRRAQIRIQQTKMAAYRNIAAWLSRHCQAVVWEGDLNLKAMAEAELSDDQQRLKRAQKNRQYAGLHNFRAALSHALGRRLVHEKAAYTTRTCSACGGRVEKTADVILECENGHRQDRDINAAINLYQRLPEELRSVTGMPVSVDRSQISRFIRPLSA